jgi:flavin-dependent dehydrogenase
MSSFGFDVAIVGAGPAGSAAAKRCAQCGLKALLLEKHKLPRHKVCGGWLYDSFSQNIVLQEFGQIPQEVLNDPPYLTGWMIHAPGGRHEKVEVRIPQAWRKNLDYWMNQKALAAGVKIWDEARVISVAEYSDRCCARLVRRGKIQELNTKFIIGCDGGRSVVRRCLYPDLRPASLHLVQQWYQGSLEGLEREYIHDFLYRDEFHDGYGGFLASLFNVAYKEDFFYVGVTTQPGRWRENMGKAHDVLAQYHSFDVKRQPVWTDSCIAPELHMSLIDGSFRPAIGNIVLAGDAAGLLDAVAGDGIGASIHSGLLAANCVVGAEQEGGKADRHYLVAMEPVISEVAKLRLGFRDAEERLKQCDGDVLLQTAVQIMKRATA